MRRNIVFLLIGLAGGFWATKFLTIDPIKSFWEIASTVGTWAAVFVALGITLKQNAEVKVLTSKKAGLVAAEILASLDSALLRIDHIYPALVFYNDAESGYSVFLVNNQFLLQEPIEIPSEMLANIVSLDDHCAHRIAFGISSLRRLREDMKSTLEVHDWGQFQAETRIKTVGEWSNVLRGAKDMIWLSREECLKVAQLAAPDPTASQLYGDDHD